MADQRHGCEYRAGTSRDLWFQPIGSFSGYLKSDSQLVIFQLDDKKQQMSLATLIYNMAALFGIVDVMMEAPVWEVERRNKYINI